MKKISGIFIFIAFLFYSMTSIESVLGLGFVGSAIPSFVWSVISVVSNLGLMLLGFYLLSSEDEN